MLSDGNEAIALKLDALGVTAINFLDPETHGPVAAIDLLQAGRALAAHESEVKLNLLLHLATGLDLMKAGYKGTAVWRWVADAVERELEPTRELHDAAVRADQIKKMRWLADARDEYVNPEVRRDTDTARHLADILDGTNDAMGWLPSWKWDEWVAIRAQLTEGDTDE